MKNENIFFMDVNFTISKWKEMDSTLTKQQCLELETLVCKHVRDSTLDWSEVELEVNKLYQTFRVENLKRRHGSKWKMNI